MTEAESGRVVVTVNPSGAHLNPYGTEHGGLVATLLDSCMGLAVQSTLEKGLGQTTVEFKVSLIGPITPETGLIKASVFGLSSVTRLRPLICWHSFKALAGQHVLMLKLTPPCHRVRRLRPEVILLVNSGQASSGQEADV